MGNRKQKHTHYNFNKNNVNSYWYVIVKSMVTYNYLRTWKEEKIKLLVRFGGILNGFLSLNFLYEKKLLYNNNCHLKIVSSL